MFFICLFLEISNVSFTKWIFFPVFFSETFCFLKRKFYHDVFFFNVRFSQSYFFRNIAKYIFDKKRFVPYFALLWNTMFKSVVLKLKTECMANILSLILILIFIWFALYNNIEKLRLFVYLTEQYTIFKIYLKHIFKKKLCDLP